MWLLARRPARGRGGGGGALHIGHLFADDRCLWSEHPQGVLRRSWLGSVGRVRRRLSYRTSRTSRTALSIDLQFPPSCPARLSRPSAPSSPHTGTRKGCTAGRSGLSRTSQTAPILSDESDKSDAAEYRPAAPSQLPRPAPAARLPSWLPGVLPADLGGRDRARPIG